MKYYIEKGVFLACITSIVIACNSTKEDSAATPFEKDRIKKEIQAKEDEFAKLYNAGEVKNIGYYADDATTFYQNRAPLIGKEAIVKFLLSDLDSNTNIISFKTNEVFPSNDGNQVVEIGYFKLVDSVNTTINTGNYMVLFEKRNGKYVSVRDMSTSDIPIQ